MSQKVLSVKAAAKFAGVSTDAIQRLLESRELAGRQIDGQWRTTRRAVLHYIDGGIGTSAGCCCPAPGAGGAGGAGGGCCSGLPGCC